LYGLEIGIDLLTFWIKLNLNIIKDHIIVVALLATTAILGAMWASSFNYNSPFQIMNEAIINYPQHVCGQ
jgi:hypothetical protein